MEYGVISYEHKYFSKKRGCQNLGDWVQTIAVERLFEKFGCASMNYLSRNTLAHYECDKTIRALVNGFNMSYSLLDYRQDTFPIPSCIEPIFFSFHIHDRVSDTVRQELINKGPVGARDEYTMRILREQGIPAYLSGCVTALLDKRENKESQNKVIIVDIPEGLEDYIPEELLQDSVVKSHKYYIDRDDAGENYMTLEESRLAKKYAEELLDFYRDHARLVITSRLHVAAPCMAMGIPVILADVDFDGRFSWIDKFLPLYNRDSWGEIDWNPHPVDYEEDKKLMREYIHDMMEASEISNSCMQYFTNYFQDRKRYDYNSIIKKNLRRFKLLQNVKYAVWGIVMKDSELVTEIAWELDNWELVGAYDRDVRGTFQNVPIEPPEKINNTEVVVIVMAKSAFAVAKKELVRKNVPYILADITQDNWESNGICQVSACKLNF